MEDWALMVVLIVLISVGGGVLRERARARRAGVDPELRSRLERIDALEERVRTLERIVTDPRHELEERFRDLDRTG